MIDRADTNQSEYISNLKVILEIIEAFFTYLPYVKLGELEYSMTYHYENTIQFNNIEQIITEIERCIQYQKNEKMEIDIPAGIVFDQRVIINDKEINLFYHGQLMIYGSNALINWNWYQSTPNVELQLNDPIPPSKILSLFESFQSAINDIKTING